MRRQLDPGPDHPISIEAKAGAVSVTLQGDTVMTSSSHLELREATYPHVAYLPRDQVDMSRLEPSDHTSWCPYKGEANYFHLRAADGSLIENAVWTYETPFPAVSEIKGALAVYPNKVDAVSIG